MRPLFLIGFMGAGKTTVGRLVAIKLGRAFCDLDREIESAESRSVEELFELRGEEGFRAVERDTLKRVAGHDEAVIACGGGVVTDEGCRAVLGGDSDVVYLAVSPEEAMARIGGDSSVRPLLRDAHLDAAAALMSSRERLYEEAADFTVLTVGRTPEEVAERVAAWVRSRP
jgi:shikimate kinase